MNRGIYFFIALAQAVQMTASAQVPLKKPINDVGDREEIKCARRVTGTLNATPANIKQGERATLGWSVVLPADCIAAGAITVEGVPAAVEGSRTVAPLASQRYALMLGTRTLATTGVDVKLPKVVRIKGSTAEWRALLLQAVVTPDTLVLLAEGVDMDLTGFPGTRIQRGVTLAGEGRPLGVSPSNAVSAVPAAVESIGLVDIAVAPFRVARTPRNPGPRLFTKDRANPLFLLDGDNIRVQGFRLQGPDLGLTDGMAKGIAIDSKLGIDVSNMELSGWSFAAVYVEDPENRMLNPDAVKIHDNFIHHNQHSPGGLGYGIDVGNSAYARIERNVFDFNRHAIAGGGQEGTGYMANQNLVLRGGGTHCVDVPLFPNPCGHTHMFDVHGSGNCGISSVFSDSQWNCGRAGQQFWVTNNAFQYTSDNAFKLRGTPSIAAVVNNNVFAHKHLDDAVHQNETGLQLGQGAQANTVNVDTYGHYGVCDFDGDGKDDLFLATGASWWYSSGGKMYWSYLNSNTERLHQVGLGDFDGDGRCDVFAVNGNRWEISSGGTGPWTALPGTHDNIPFAELRFHDFDGDRITDVFLRAPDGQWFAFASGTSAPRALQSSDFPLSALRFGDFNGDGVTDVLSLNDNVWSVSLSATGQGPLATLKWASSLAAQRPALGVLSFVGRFEGRAAADLLAVDFTRLSRIHSTGHADFTAYSLYAY
jgi:hypothetical protein